MKTNKETAPPICQRTCDEELQLTSSAENSRNSSPTALQVKSASDSFTTAGFPKREGGEMRRKGERQMGVKMWATRFKMHFMMGVMMGSRWELG